MPDAEKPDPKGWQRFVALARQVVQTPKAEVEKREQAWRRSRNARRGKKAK